MSKTTPTLVNLNTAGLETLTQLPGVGPALARRIVAARPFQSVRDLILVNGVGPRLYANLLPHLTVDEAPPGAEPPPGPVSPDSAITPEITPETLSAPAAVGLAAPPEQDAATPPGEPPPNQAETPSLRPTPYFGPPGPLTVGQATPEPPAEVRGRNYLLSIPLRTRWRILLALFYGMIGLALVGLVALFYAALRNTPLLAPAATPPAGAAVTQVATLPGPAITAVAATPSSQISATATRPSASATPASSATLAGAVAGSETSAPPFTDTAAPTATQAPPSPTLPSATATSPPTLAPSATRTPPPSATPTAPPTGTPTLTPAPSATSTRTPSPTSVPTSPAGAGALLFTETFDPPAFYWGVGNTNFSRSAIGDGRLQVQVDRAALVYIFGNMPPAKDFYYQATARPGACGEGDGYGLQFRANNDLNFYLFGVTCEGRVRVQVLAGGQYTILVDTPQPNPAVRIGPGAVNVLAVRVVGQQFQFYANGRLLTTLADETVPEGRFGLYARSRQTPAFDVVFDDIFAWSPAE